MANDAPKTKPQPEPEYDAAHVPITEEFDRAKWTLPPIVPVLIALAVVAVAVAAFVYGTRYRPVIGGEVQQMYAEDVPNQSSVLVAIQVKVSNIGGEKPIVLHGATAVLTGPDGKQYPDRAASAVDYARYFQAFPDLRQHATAAALQPDTKLPVGTVKEGMLLFGFPVDKAAFDQRKGLEVEVEVYDQKPLKLTVK